MSIIHKIKNWWNTQSAPTPVQRTSLRSPVDLQRGDIIRFGYLPQQDLSNTQFEVTHVNTYVYDEIAYPEMILKDSKGHLRFLMVEVEDGEEYLAFSRKINKEQLPNIFSEQELAKIEQPGRGTALSASINTAPADLKPWLASQYRETNDGVRGSFVKGDYRNNDDVPEKGHETFTSHELIDGSGEFAVEIEVYKSGEREVSVTIYHDFDAIVEMWPGE